MEKTYTIQDSKTANVMYGLERVSAQNAILQRLIPIEPLDVLLVGEGTHARDLHNSRSEWPYFIVRES